MTSVIQPVLFYGRTSVFSNWYPHRFVLDGFTFRWAEPALLMEKTFDLSWRRRIRESASPAEAKRLGRQCPMRPEWADPAVKLEHAVRVGLAKFGSSPIMRRVLLATGNRPIHENCADPVWGGGPNYPRGLDLLGRSLVIARDRLRGDVNGLRSAT